MKLHRNLTLAVVPALELIFHEKKVAARVLESLFAKNPKWGKRDRAFVAETTYEIVRWRRLLAFAAQSEGIVALLGAQLIRSGADFPDWSELSHLDAAQIRANLTKNEVDSTKNEAEVTNGEANFTKNEENIGIAEETRAIRQSIPDWLDELGARELGEEWDAEIAALNAEAPVFLRANTLKISRDELQSQLESEGVSTQIAESLPDALKLETRRSLSHLSLYKDGFFEIQDGASQFVAPFLQVHSGQKILDACAGAGGKSLHLAALIKNRGHIVSCDLDAKKLEELRRRASRSGISCLETKTPKTLESHGQSFERILIDAPCSGLGTLRRQPDLKWRLSLDFLSELQQKQRQILEFYAPMLQIGGKLVYATCSILPGENERQIAWFLAHNSNFKLESQKMISPAQTGFDGFFMARLRRL
ncbi:16S rRNA (cytosine967-C5)-methyltransferase [Abditibacterium utsteinense]|uniref:16S rRNA (Cytosine967-C5)-methyltransferase n=1 Tax=Abditibacterium utsteinense TaxID=1960156 RepID=A0A2S8SW17_9BACT|nr:class I SAM-dependent methyltransferase [Abditibacterium utsteinense]PQV64990.1 16S rRNA (cytosine967-C5)-methyltransferase [Abditibacterium utsteinense]